MVPSSGGRKLLPSPCPLGKTRKFSFVANESSPVCASTHFSRCYCLRKREAVFLCLIFFPRSHIDVSAKQKILPHLNAMATSDFNRKSQTASAFITITITYQKCHLQDQPLDSTQRGPRMAQLLQEALPRQGLSGKGLFWKWSHQVPGRGHKRQIRETTRFKVSS